MASENIFELYGEIKDDLKFITSSDIRAKIIISLKEGQKKLGDLKDDVHMRSSSILHSMSQLESRNLIIREFQSYSLSQTGEMAAISIIDMVNSFSLTNKHKDFWLSHEINEIPENLIGKIDCLGDFKVLRSSLTDFPDQSIFKELFLESKVVKGILSPLIIHDELNVINEKENIRLILANSSLNEVLKRENSKNTGTIENIKLWKLKNDLKLVLVVTDNFLLLNLPSLNKKHDSINYLMSETKESIEWGTELFNYYLNQAEELDEIQQVVNS